MAADRNKPRRQKPGRRPRRWLRGLGVVLVFVLVLVVLVSFLAEPLLRERLTSAVEENLASQVRLGAVSVTWLPLGAELRNLGLRLEGESEDYLTVDRIAASVALADLVRGKIGLDEAVVERPILRVRVRDDGSIALPRPQGQGGGRTELRSLTVRDGEFQWRDIRLPLDATLNGLRLTSTTSEDATTNAEFSADQMVVAVRGQPLQFGVAGQAQWAADSFQLKDLEVTGDRIRARGHGIWDQGEARFDVEGHAELAQFAPWMGASGKEVPVSGSIEIRGVVSKDDDDHWAANGSGAIDTLAAAGLTLDSVPLAFSWTANEWRVESNALRAYASAWTVALEQRGESSELSLSTDGAQTAELASDLGWEMLPRGGALAVSMDYRFPNFNWRGGEGKGVISLMEGGDSFLTGRMPFDIQPGLQIDLAGELSAKADLASIGGKVDVEQGQGELHFEATTQDVAFLLEQVGLENEWLPNRGRGTVIGDAILRPESGPTVVLEADLEQVRLASLNADSAVVEAEVNSAGFDLRQAVLRLGDGELVASGQFADAGSALSTRVVEWPIQQLLPLAQVDLPLRGLATGNTELTLTPELAGTLNAEIKNPRWDDLGLGKSIRAPLVLAGDRVRFEDGVWQTDSGAVNFTGSYEFSGGWSIEASSEELMLGREIGTIAIVAPDYRASFGLRLTGSDFVENGHVHLVTHAAGAPAADLAVEFADGVLEAHGDVAKVLNGVVATGAVGREGPNLELSAAIRPDLWTAGTAWESTGMARVRAEAQGSWQEMTVDAEVFDVDVDVAGQNIQEIEPILAHWSADKIEVESAFFENTVTGGELFVAGTLDLSTQALDGVVQAEVAALWLDSLAPGVTAQGPVSFLGVIEGTRDAPVVDGQGLWQNGTLSMEGFPHTLTSLDTRFLVGPEGVIIDRAHADLGGGKVTGTGDVVLAGEGQEFSYRARLTADDVNLNLPEDWWMGGDATLRIEGTAEARTLSGEVRLDRAVLLESIDLGVEQMVRSALVRQREWVASADELLRSTRVELAVVGEGALRVSGEGLNLNGDIDLSVRGDLASPQLLGRVDLAPGGDLTFRGNDFDVERGVLIFSDPNAINPDVDIVAGSRVRSYDVRLHLQGSLEAMEVGFSSDPSLPSLEVVSLLTTGQVGTRPLLLDSIQPTESAAAEGVIAGQAAEALGARVGKLFGLDRVQIDPLTESSGQLSSARITIGKRLSKNVFATYTSDPSDAENDQQVVRLEWQMTPITSVILTQNGDDTYAVDFQWQRSF